jgi:hypothetical protein
LLILLWIFIWPVLFMNFCCPSWVPWQRWQAQIGEPKFSFLVTGIGWFFLAGIIASLRWVFVS